MTIVFYCWISSIVILSLTISSFWQATLADVIFFVTMEWFEAPPYADKGLENYPMLVGLRDRLAANELAKHLKERPSLLDSRLK